MRQMLPMEQMIEPHIRQLFVDRILTQPRREIREIDTVHFLILVEAGEDDGLLAGLRIHVLLQALRADFLHHALHRRVDAGDGHVARLEVGRQHTMPRGFDGRHHAIRSDRDDAIH